MAEKRIVYQDKFVSFEGLFNLKDLFRIICKWVSEHGYDMLENKNYEEVYEDGKKLICELIPYKKVSDYHKLEIRIFFVCENLKEVEVEVHGVKQKLFKGRVDLTFDAILETDFENRWESRPSHYFYRAIIDKFIYKSYTDKYEKMLVKEAKELQEEIKAYLNMFRFSAAPAKESPPGPS